LIFSSVKPESNHLFPVQQKVLFLSMEYGPPSWPWVFPSSHLILNFNMLSKILPILFQVRPSRTHHSEDASDCKKSELVGRPRFTFTRPFDYSGKLFPFQRANALGVAVVVGRKHDLRRKVASDVIWMCTEITLLLLALGKERRKEFFRSLFFSSIEITLSLIIKMKPTLLSPALCVLTFYILLSIFLSCFGER